MMPVALYLHKVPNSLEEAKHVYVFYDVHDVYECFMHLHWQLKSPNNHKIKLLMFYSLLFLVQ